MVCQILPTGQSPSKSILSEIYPDIYSQDFDPDERRFSAFIESHG